MSARVQRMVLAALVAFFVAAGLAGVDFGDRHWDEPTNVKEVGYAFAHRVPFPRDYRYPSFLSWTLAACAIPELAAHGFDEAPRAMMAPSYRLRARGVLVLLTSLAIVCTWACARGLGRSAGESLVAAAFVATSFQLGTHARFIAPDGLAVAWVSAALACLAVSVGPGPTPGSRSSRWLLASAACIGVAASTKYTAGALLPLVMWLAWRTASNDARARVLATAKVALASALAFVVVTPGALLEPAWFMNGLRFQQLVYSQGWQGYTVGGPLAMVRALGGWLAFASLAPWWPLALACCALALIGARVLWREGGAKEPDARVASSARALVLAGPLLVIAFAPQHVFISRNFLPLLPVLAVCAARGFTAARAALAARVHVRASHALTMFVVGTLAASAIDTALAAETVRNRSDDRLRAEIARAVEQSTDGALLVSPRVRAQLPDRLALRARSEVSSLTTHVIAFPDELLAEGSWPGTDAFLVDEVIGPREIDWRYAPTWRGSPRVVVMTIEKARATGASLTFTPAPAPERARMPMELLLRD